MEEKDVTKTELKKVAKELNEQLGLEPPILVDLKASALKVKVVEAATLIDPKEDTFSDAAWEILEALGACARPESEEVEDDTNADDVEEEEEVEDDEEEEVEEDEPEEEEADEDAEATEDVEGAAADVAVEEALVSTLASDFKEAKKLIDLKKLVQEWDIFSEIDIAAPCYAGLSGPRKLRTDMLECMPEEVRNQIEPKPVPKAEKAEKGAKGPKEKKAKATKGPGVISTIVEAIEGAGKEGITKDEILKKLVAVFPERSSESMKKTIWVQVPSRISKEKFKVGVIDGRYFKE